MAQKICKLVKKGLHTENPKKFMSLVRGSHYLCTSCGRTAAKKKPSANLKNLELPRAIKSQLTGLCMLSFIDKGR